MQPLIQPSDEVMAPNQGVVIGSGGTLITTERGQKTLEDEDISFQVADLSSSLLYTALAD